MDDLAHGKDLKRIVEQGYDRVAIDYGNLEGAHEWPRMRWLTKLLARLLPGSRVLDLGCGSGVPADVEIVKQHRLTGVDISQAQLDLARQNIAEGTFLHADAATVGFPPGSFDAVVSIYTLEHIPRTEHEELFRRVYSWLSVGGYLLLSMEAADCAGVVERWLGVPMFMSCYIPPVTRGLMIDAGFEIVEYAIETQLERDVEIPYHWVLARKPFA